MQRKCNICGMLRAQKDMVVFDDGSYMCFSCWNKHLREKRKRSKK
ncbi:MAG: hypothetical protein ACFFA0_02890 [Promethearchaeota archaeon]